MYRPSHIDSDFCHSTDSGYNSAMVKQRSNQEELTRFFKGGTRLTYSKGEIIIRPEDTPQGVFFIEEGFVKSYDITKYGEENLLVIRKSGQIFPILWTMTDERTDVFYQAMSDTVLYRVDRKAYNDKIDGNETEFIKSVLEQVLLMYKIHSDRVLNLEYRSAAERVAYRLLTLSRRFGKKTGKGTMIEAPIRHHDIASSVNCSRETASREISKLEKKGFVSSKSGYIVINDPKGLMEKIEQKRSLSDVIPDVIQFKKH